jgi:hypothetical protein
MAVQQATPLALLYPLQPAANNTAAPGVQLARVGLREVQLLVLLLHT